MDVQSQREAHERAMEDGRTTLRHETLVMRRRFNTLKSESEVSAPSSCT